MKTLFVAVLAAVAIAPLPSLAAHDHAGHAMAAPAQGTALVEGLVKKVDKSTGKVTLAHGPLTNLGMPAMTMAFRVREAAWLERMKDGDRVRFMADKVNGAFTVVHLEAVK